MDENVENQDTLKKKTFSETDLQQKKNHKRLQSLKILSCLFLFLYNIKLYKTNIDLENP